GADLLERDQHDLLLATWTDLSRTVEPDALFPRIADNLFNLFRQADRCFIIQSEGERLVPRVVKTRHGGEEMARFNRGMVRKCLEKTRAFLFEDAVPRDRFHLSQSVSDFLILSVMCAPLYRADGKAFGVIQIDTQDRGKKFTEKDLRLLGSVANQASIALENARLLDEGVRQQRLQRDLQ